MTWTAALDAAANAHNATFGEPITVGATNGRGILTPDAAARLGGGIEVSGGARLAVRSSEFPNLEIHDSVTRGADSFVIVEIDRALDAAGFCYCTLARA